MPVAIVSVATHRAGCPYCGSVKLRFVDAREAIGLAYKADTEAFGGVRLGLYLEFIVRLLVKFVFLGSLLTLKTWSKYFSAA